MCPLFLPHPVLRIRPKAICYALSPPPHFPIRLNKLVKNRKGLRRSVLWQKFSVYFHWENAQFLSYKIVLNFREILKNFHGWSLKKLAIDYNFSISLTFFSHASSSVKKNVYNAINSTNSPAYFAFTFDVHFSPLSQTLPPSHSYATPPSSPPFHQATVTKAYRVRMHIFFI